MAKFQCLCGATISTSGAIPNPMELHLIPDDRIGGLVGAERLALLLQAAVPVYRCPNSDHLWVFWRGYDAPATPYQPVEIDDARNPSRWAET